MLIATIDNANPWLKAGFSGCFAWANTQTATPVAQRTAGEVTFEIRHRSGVSAEAVEEDGEFVVLEGSEALKDTGYVHLGVDPDEGIESVLFVLHQPPWTSKEGDPRFWNAKGIVADFLSRLQDIALAPIVTSRNVPVSLWNSKQLEFKYLYIKDIVSLRDLVGAQRPAEFFRDMESTHVSQLIDEVRIRVRLKKNDGTVTFRELSEGEQQLLTVLGLLRFTAESESLFLLDEPDTHLNPRWALDYLSYLRKFAGQNDGDRENSHILITTHNPLAIAELEKEQVQILQLSQDKGDSKIVAVHPELDPRGQCNRYVLHRTGQAGHAQVVHQPAR